MDVDQLKAAFKKYDDEYLRFENIPEEDRLSMRPDMHAFKLLDTLVPGREGFDLISGATHDEYFLSIELEKLAKVASEKIVETLVRCGVRIDDEGEGLALFA